MKASGLWGYPVSAIPPRANAYQRVTVNNETNLPE